MPLARLADPAAALVPDPRDAVLRRVERAIAALRRGEIVLLEDAEAPPALALALETASPAALVELVRLAGGAVAPALVLGQSRAAVLGLPGVAPADESANGVDSAVALTPAEPLAAEAAAALLRLEPQRQTLPAALTEAALGQATPLQRAGFRLVKLARLLPVVALARLPDLPRPGSALAAALALYDPVRIARSEIESHRERVATALTPVADAQVALADAEQTEVIAFRAGDGGVEHLAIIIGAPDPAQPPLVRLHSECFTGDLLGSLRCDCGQQLRGAIALIQRSGGGVLLYLAQEGRGIGLINKLRAYRLQDQGFDTVDANMVLGFEADERSYQPAAEMLQRLGFPRIRLLTNNPAKITQLTRFGIEVVERVPHAFPPNPHNAPYLRAKAERGGHLL